MRRIIVASNYYSLGLKPLMIGIAGDSSSGKDTLVDAIARIFGDYSVTKVSGDDYHLWDRHKPMWQVMTHLNPKANNLEKFTSDILGLADRKSITHCHYDHSTGKMSTVYQVDSNLCILVSGLHALYIKSLRERYDLSIYLDIDEKLRRYFKIKRDIAKRGHSEKAVLESINKRENDSELFIRPQAEYANLVFCLQPIQQHIFNDKYDTNLVPSLKLVIKANYAICEVILTRILVGLCGLHVDTNFIEETSKVELTIEGDVNSQDISLAASKLVPDLYSLFDYNPVWEDGMLGVMQLVILIHIDDILKKGR